MKQARQSARQARLKVSKKNQLKRRRAFKKKITKYSKALSGLKSPYVLISLAVLFLTSLLWSILGARLQQGNADELIEGLLFQSPSTFNGALFPSTHSFLIKWPLFLIVGLTHNNPVALTLLSIFVSLLTIAGLVYVLYRIDKRSRVFGTLVLALASVLLLIPAQPYAGAILPVNFAMLETRNIEYLFYICALVFVIRSRALRTTSFLFSVILFSLLFTSDKLFESFALGSAVITFVVYFILRKRAFAVLGMRLFISAGLSTVIAALLIGFINLIHLTHIVGGGTGPYSFITTLKDLGLGVAFAILGILTNLGANPAFDIGMLKSIPSTVLNRLIAPEAVPFILNFLVFVASIFGVVKVFKLSLIPPKKPRWNVKKIPLPFTQAVALSVLLLASLIVAIGEFVLTSHYYPVDSRYLTIVLFVAFICLATYLRSRPLPLWIGGWRLGVLLFAGIIIGSFWTVTTHQQQASVYSEISARNQKVADVLKNHKTDLLVGDYWRVVPISQLDNEKSDSIVPLGGCTVARNSLTSTSWQSDLKHHSFSYLLSLDKSLTDYPQCTIDQIVSTYGHPNASTLIAGTNEHPKEILLSYDAGTTLGRPHPRGSQFATILPSTTKQVQVVAPPLCTNNVRVMNIVAHQDDDLLFINPDLQHEIANGACIRTVYVTAGDAGQDSVYWLGREQGSEAAYDVLLGLPSTTVWTQKTIKLKDNEYVTAVNPRGDRKVTLIFMRLPDGNLTGAGFSDSQYESLQKLNNGSIPVIQSVDQQSSYTSDQLTAALTQLMTFYQPTLIQTQAPKNYGTNYHDHSDHIAVGKYVDRAFSAYPNALITSVEHYVGYPIRQLAPNIEGNDLTLKTNAFLAYAQHDAGVCQSVDMCDATATYNAYLHRNYTTEQY